VASHLSSRQVQYEGMKLDEVIRALMTRIDNLEDALADYGLLVYEENGNVRIQSESDKSS